MITDDKITEIFCATDEFSKKFDEDIENMPLLSSDGKARRHRAVTMSDSEIMTILIMFHFGTFDNFKHYYLPQFGIRKSYKKLVIWDYFRIFVSDYQLLTNQHKNKSHDYRVDNTKEQIAAKTPPKQDEQEEVHSHRGR